MKRFIKLLWAVVTWPIAGIVNKVYDKAIYAIQEGSKAFRVL